MKRIKLHVRYDRKMGTWFVRSTDRPENTVWVKYGAVLSKQEAIHAGAEYLYDMLGSEGTRGQLIIHKKDGRIQSERTYGGDPKRRKG